MARSNCVLHHGTGSKQKPMPRNCLQMNELSQSGLEKYLTTKWKWAVLCSSPPKQCSVVYMEWSLMTEPGWKGGRNVFGGESCLNQLYKSWPLFVYTRTLCKEHEGLPKGKQGLLKDCKCPEIGFNLKQCWEMWWLLILMCASIDLFLRLSFSKRPSIALTGVSLPISVILVLPIAVFYYCPLSTSALLLYEQPSLYVVGSASL